MNALIKEYQYQNTSSIFSDNVNLIEGSDKDDILSGTSQDDTLIGGSGNDKLYGGAGNDTYVFAKGHGKDLISDEGGEADTIQFLDVNFEEVKFWKKTIHCLFMVITKKIQLKYEISLILVVSMR